MPLGYNRVLGDDRTRAESRPHRVALASWPTTAPDPRARSLDALIGHAQSAGYDGLELGPASLERYFPGESPMAIARKSRDAIEKAGLQNFGTTLHFTDEEMRSLQFLELAREQLEPVVVLGGQFASYQLFIHPDHANGGGAYREDERYLSWAADRVTELRDLTWEHGLNFYLEVHVDRITEDPAALCRILELATCELNGDMSHYLARGFTRGPHVGKIQGHVGHTHVRMARKYGDLSAAVDDPKADWEAGGVTWQAFDFMKPALDGGLSSRSVVGESGPMHLVTDTLTLDASLVPLYRAMARYADASAQGMKMKVDEPGDLRPWG
jgi:sugar phosphate isomerase/epimerase